MTGDKSAPPKHRLSAKPFQFYQINWAGSVQTGGLTGSVRVVIHGENYQYKPPIIENSWIRRLKSNDVDSENFGELLASRIAKEFDLDDKNERIPKVGFVVKNHCKDVGIASKYLKGTSVRTLDDHLDPRRKRRGSHVVLNRGTDAPGEGVVPINHDPLLKKELARAIALSALVGDHDVNPGNMVVITDSRGIARVGRIDFGHAFNDLLRFPRFGGHKVAENNIIDFFNRTSVDGPNKPQSRIWRNYPGLIPSRDMAEALREISSEFNKEQRISDVVASVKEDVRQMLENNPQVDKEHVVRSFQRISEHVSGKVISNKLNTDEKLDQIFQDIEDYVQLNIKQMAYAADIMMLQVDIREALINKEPRKLLELKKTHELFFSQSINSLLHLESFSSASLVLARYSNSVLLNDCTEGSGESLNFSNSKCSSSIISVLF